METLWPQIERLLLGRVQAGPLHRGRAGRPVPRARPGQGGLAAALPRHLRDRACPTRGCRSSTRSSTSAPTPWPSAPTPPGWTWRRPCGPPGCRCSAWSSTSPARDFDVMAFNLSAELVYTNVAQPDRPGRGAAARGRPGPGGPAGHRRRALRLQPRAPGRLRRRLRPGRRRGGGRARSTKPWRAWLARPATERVRERAAAGPGRRSRGLRPCPLPLDLSRRPSGVDRARPGPACRPRWPSGR